MTLLGAKLDHLAGSINPAIEKTRSDRALVTGTTKILCAGAGSLGNVCLCSSEANRSRNASKGIYILVFRCRVVGNSIEHFGQQQIAASGT